MIDCHRFEEFAVVIDDQRNGKTPKSGFVARQLAAVELQLDVPAEGGNACRHRLERIPGEHAAGQKVKAHAAHAGTRQARQFDVGDIGRHGGDSARGVPERGERLERAAIVEAVAVGLHDDRAREPQLPLDLQIIAQRRVRRLESRLRHQREPVFVDVHMAVAGVRDPQPGCIDALDHRGRWRSAEEMMRIQAARSGQTTITSTVTSAMMKAQQ